MKTLIETIEAWIDERVYVASRVLEFEAKFKEMEELHIRDAERIATLERRMLEIGDSSVEESMFEGDRPLEEIKNTVEDLESRFNDLESEVEDAQSAIEDIPDTYSIEVMIDDALETKVMDAVRAEIDATDFKVTVER